MNKTIFLQLLMAVSFAAMPQVRHIAPATTLPLPSQALMDEFVRLSAIEPDKCTSQDYQRIGQIVEDNAVFDELYSSKCSWYCGGQIDTITATSTLKSLRTSNYAATNAHDFDHTTAWVEGVSGPGIGQTLTYEFPGSCPRITTINILNGYVKSDKAWSQNNRVAQLMLYYRDQPLAILDLEDTRDMQQFQVDTLGYNDPDAPKWQLRFEILKVYPGTTYDDTAITELWFDGIDVH